MRKTIYAIGFSMALAGLLTAGCTTADSVGFNPAVAQTASPTPTPTPTPTPINQVQVEQLARPGINEVLLINNASLNTYNAVSPSFIAAALANPSGPQGTAAAPVLTEALTTLRTFVALNTTLTPAQVNTTTNAIAGALLPDVLRIDTTVNMAVNATAYTAEFNTAGAPCSGRKLTDDVVDISLNLLTQGAVTGDGVPYYKPVGNTNPNIGHQNLNGQTTQFGPATFPFLAPAN